MDYRLLTWACRVLWSALALALAVHSNIGAVHGENEMFAFYKTRGVRLIDKLNEIYNTYGCCLNTLHSYEFPGSAGMEKMKGIMTSFRSVLDDVAGKKITITLDYSKGLDGLPKSNVLKYKFDGGSVVVRPSGTEPKLKTYISVTAENKESAEEIEKRISADIEKRM